MIAGPSLMAALEVPVQASPSEPPPGTLGAVPGLVQAGAVLSGLASAPALRVACPRRDCRAEPGQGCNPATLGRHRFHGARELAAARAEEELQRAALEELDDGTPIEGVIVHGSRHVPDGVAVRLGAGRVAVSTCTAEALRQLAIPVEVAL